MGNREVFKKSLDDLFDVAHVDALCLIKVKEDRDFLLAQRRPGSLRLEMSLGRQLIYLACRHHMMEIVLEHVFSALLTEQSRSPDITLFLNFRDMWPIIDQTKYTIARDDESTLHRVQPWCEETVSFAQDQLLRKHPRDDYKELLELVIN